MANFIPQTRTEAVAMYVKTARDYWRAYTRPGSIGRQVARKAVAKAKRIKRAEDWKKELWSDL